MLDADARRMAAAIEQRVNAPGGGISATVETHSTQPDGGAPGAGRPSFVRYYVRVSDGTRSSAVELNQAGAVLDDLETGCGADRLFATLGAHDVAIEDVE